MSHWIIAPVVLPALVAAVMVIVEEAGGTFTDRHGERTYEHDTAISSNGLLHHCAKMLAVWKGSS